MSYNNLKNKKNIFYLNKFYILEIKFNKENRNIAFEILKSVPFRNFKFSKYIHGLRVLNKISFFWMKKIIIFLFSIAVIFFVTEIYLSIIQNNFVIKNIFSKYSDLEKDKILDFKLKNMVLNVKPRFITKMQWILDMVGAIKKSIQIALIISLKNTTNIVFFGDSTIDNYEAPNYLTSLEYLTFGESDKFRSINLSEGGSRLSDQISIFRVYTKVENKTSIAFFFNGYHEFTSIQYNGNPKYNFYWTTTINNLIHNPIVFFYQSILEKR